MDDDDDNEEDRALLLKDDERAEERNSAGSRPLTAFSSATNESFHSAFGSDVSGEDWKEFPEYKD